MQLIKILMILLLVYSSFVGVCSCEPVTLLEKWQKSKNVFLVKVNKIDVINKGNEVNFESGEVRGAFDVLNVF